MRVWILFQDYFEDRTTIGVYPTEELAKTKGIEDWRLRGAWRTKLVLDKDWQTAEPTPGFPSVFWRSAWQDGERTCTLYVEAWDVFEPKAKE